MIYESADHFIYIKNPDFKYREIFKRLNGIWFSNKKAKGWRFPKNIHVYRELYKSIPELKSSQSFVSDGKAVSEETKYWLNLKNPDLVDTFNVGLRPYQNQDVAFLTQRGSSLVLNEPRTGKTPTMLKVLEKLSPRFTLIVTPSSLTYNWRNEIEKWIPDFIPVVYAGTPKQRLDITIKMNHDRFDKSKKIILIMSKDTLKREITDWNEYKFDVAIVDEAHFLRNYNTAQSKALYQISAKIKYALTGTPAVKHAVDIFGLLHFIKPEAFPSYWQFAERYFVIEEGMWGKSIGDPKSYRQEELLTLMRTIGVQRKRKEVMDWLPDAQYQTLSVKMEKKQLKLYEDMLETFVASDDGVEVDTMNVLSQLMRLRQLCLDPRLLGFDTVGTKTKALLEFTEDNLDPFIVMTTFSSYFKLIIPELERLGKRVGIIDGSLSQSNKFATAEAFQKGKYDILLCNIIAAGTGFTLDRADTVVFLDKDFNPANNEQAQDRIVPTTKERYHNINIISLVVDGSIDARVNDILDRKEDLTKIINKGELFA